MASFYSIDVVCNGITSKNHIFTDYDYEVVDTMYRSHDENGHPVVYNFLYRYISALPIDNKKPILTLSPDPAISGSTVSAMAEKYMFSEFVDNKVKFYSKLKIIYVTSSSHILTNYKDVTVENLRNSVIANLLCLRPNTYMGSKLRLSVDQFQIIGINDNLFENDEREELDRLDISYFTLKQMRKKGIKNVMDVINEKIGDSPVMVVYDMSVTAWDAAPCVSRFLKDGIKTNTKLLNGFDVAELRELFLSIKKDNLVALDITSFDFRIDNKERAYRISCEMAKVPLFTLFRLKEKKINIFNEHSKFLIFRPIEQTSPSDLGWMILKCMSLEDREIFIKEIGDDNIISIETDIDGSIETVLVTVTTIDEQEQKSFYDPDLKISDCVLYPAQKLYMMFELLNTPENSLHT